MTYTNRGFLGPSRKLGERSPDFGGEGRSPERHGPPLLDDPTCPIKPLGHRLGRYWFFSPCGELREFSKGEMKREPLKSLFDGDLSWIYEHFPTYEPNGTPKAGTWSHDSLSIWLIQACAARGLFDATMPQRGPGVWRQSGQSDDLVVHLGDRLFFPAEIGENRYKSAGDIIERTLYPASPALKPPADDIALPEHGNQLLQAIKRWKFKRPYGADLVFGFFGAALLGAAPQWRAHILVTGERGSGKSWLADLVSTALGDAGHPPHNDYTEAGLRQALTGEARALVLDESENTAHGNRIQAVIELLRRMSGGEGAKTVRGSAEGRARAFSVSGCAYLSAIIHVPLLPQDRSRITIVELGALPTGAAVLPREPTLTAIAKAGAFSAAFRARALARWPVFYEAFRLYRDAFIAEMACDARQAEQIATLLAGRDMLLHDAPPDAAAVSDEISQFAELIVEVQEEDEEGEGEQCLNRLYTSLVERWQSGDRCTVSEAIFKGCRPGDAGSEYRESLGRIGIKVVGFEKPTSARLLIANAHVGLEKIFRDTRWQGGGWRQALRYLPGVKASNEAIRFTGIRSRATELPTHLLPEDESERPYGVKRNIR